MVNSLLFRWEDSQALQHHCGFCERPLSHPGARASCFGTHSEPCHRFHQAMFMRNRAHICNYCSTIDEAHYKRHHDLVTQLRCIYESCGELDWTIVPAEPGDPRRGRSSDAQLAGRESSDHSLTPEETPTSKRERKDAKCLARAANRARVVTQEEIRYVDSVLHSAEGVSSSDGADPANLEEMQLIEEHLRYNANVYNSHSSRRDLRRFAKIPDVDVDFEAEMERVLDTFRITELVKRNLRNRGLQGKELKSFEGSIEAFKSAVVEDLVLVKKDMMEIRMRRAGYLRYTNKTAYGIVENRYTEKDWKTGERITSSSSESSGLTSPSEELVTPQSAVPDIIVSPVLPSTKGPDRRHLQHFHTRVSGNDGLGQKVIKPYHAPLLPLTPNKTPKGPAVLKLKVVENKENRIPVGMTNRRWLRRDVARQAPLTRPLPASEEGNSPPSTPSFRRVPSNEPVQVIKPAWGKVAAFTSSPAQQDPAIRVDRNEFPALYLPVKAPKSISPKSDAPAVQPTTEDEIAGLRGPERAITPDNDTGNAHPIVSQKKAKKAQREAKRKVKKVSDPEETSSPTAVEEAGVEKVEQGFSETLLGSSTVNSASHAMEKMPPQSPVSLRELIDDGKVDASIGAVEEQITVLVVPKAPSPPTLPYTTHGKHDHWTRFARVFIVDQLTAPLLQSFEGCSHGSSCRFESHGVPDCPFHEPHCPCGDPLRNQCYLMHPGKQLCTAGPYNRAHGERMMATYEQHTLTKGRVMLVDDDLVSYFMDINNTPSKPDLASMPPRLLREHTDFLDGYERGPLMRQELEFERLFVKNMAMRHPLTMRMLQDIQRQNSGRKGSVKLCYCGTEMVPNAQKMKTESNKGFVSCSYGKCGFGGVFHKRCVKKLGVEKVSRWYCTACEKQMKILAYKALGIPYIDGDAVIDGAEKMIAEMIAKPGGPMDRFKSRLQELYMGDACDDSEVEDVD
ncbi:hypothetical protein BU25DRAFT_481786 [Macroventuria anomochaeta]|uniref:Uncharacterized protein n=1 Tax=Macroventuria anomochaeta TaxID=301207 RepID=A0ACB6SDN9_9PLEO|nr:uncharacterized protein BU25DRAFT_481786 [Macroventuria anomochaeta]KAF2631222.1 hypothetical protein BU25DRAFT_481786 [Macroventuria anomochaeta]